MFLYVRLDVAEMLGYASVTLHVSSGSTVESRPESTADLSRTGLKTTMQKKLSRNDAQLHAGGRGQQQEAGSEEDKRRREGGSCDAQWTSVFSHWGQSDSQRSTVDIVISNRSINRKKSISVRQKQIRVEY